MNVSGLTTHLSYLALDYCLELKLKCLRRYPMFIVIRADYMKNLPVINIKSPQWSYMNSIFRDPQSLLLMKSPSTKAVISPN